jgi:cobalt-zinc-cadmium efflux system membrane fusion protein
MKQQRISTGPRFLTLIVPVGIWLLFGGCHDRSGTEGEKSQPPRRASVSDDGLIVSFPRESAALQQVTSTAVKKGSATISVIAPSRVVASFVGPNSDGDKVVLFDSPEVTSLYSQYRQSRANATRTAKNLTRAKEMFGNQASTAKDLNDAENDAATARASMAEYESKLRGLGFNPGDLDTARPGSIWLISDVTEAQLPDVQKGEDVDIVFSSFPDKKFVGRADAVGDVVDQLTRTVKVRVSMANRQGRFLPGMYAAVDYGDPIGGVVVLPPSAIVTVEGRDYVFVETAPGEFRRRQVTVLKSGADRIILTQGVEDGDHVVMNGAMLLKGLSFGY